MADIPPGPLCTSTLGSDWIDAGTLCVARSAAPGSAGGRAWTRDPFASVSGARVYSKAAESAWKRDFDERLELAGVRVAPDSGLYWRSLIGCLSPASACTNVDGLGFYVVRGGWEGFLARGYAQVDANHAAWDARAGTTDVNDALVVLDPAGALVGAFQLAVPNYYARTSRMVGDDWNGRSLFGYYNDLFGYYGLAVLDKGKLPRYDPAKKHHEYWIDIHHRYATLGCIEVARSAGVANADFDAFVRALMKTHGRDEVQLYQRDGPGYVPAPPPTEAGTAAAFPVHMGHYLGVTTVIDLPRR